MICNFFERFSNFFKDLGLILNSKTTKHIETEKEIKHLVEERPIFDRIKDAVGWVIFNDPKINRVVFEDVTGITGE